MSLYLPDPVAPGTVDPGQLDQVRELHAAVRQWLEDAATQQKSDHIRASFPYADLMFALGFATLGDHATANMLVEDARTVMEGPIPEGGTPRADQAVTSAVVRNLLFKALRFRIDEALAGRPHVGGLSSEFQYDLDQIRTRCRQGRVNNPHKLALYAIGRFLEQYRSAEPEERADPYLDFTPNPDATVLRLAALRDTHEPGKLAQMSCELLASAEAQDNPEVARLVALSNVLPLAGRGGEAFALELVQSIPEAIAALPPTGRLSPDIPLRLASLIEIALCLTARYRRAEESAPLARTFAEAVYCQPDSPRFVMFRRGAGMVVRVLQAFDKRNELQLLLAEWQQRVFGGQSVAELRAKHDANRETWAEVLGGLQALAGGWRWLGEQHLAEPIVTEAQRELLKPEPRPLSSKEYTELARAYITAEGNDWSERGFDALIGLFRGAPPKAIRNTWQTAQYYSRFHLNLVEDAVFAVCKLCLDNPTPVTVSV